MASQPSNATSDPFDPAALRISGAIIPTEKILTAVPIRKPKRDEFFRVHPGEDFTMDVAIVEREGDFDRDVYLVMPACLDAVSEVARVVRLFTCLNRRGTTFLWLAKLPAEGGNSSGNRYAETGLKVAERAKADWVRMYGSRDLGAYEMVVARGNLDGPKWQDKTFSELMHIACEGRIIDGPDHPVIRELNGEL